MPRTPAELREIIEAVAVRSTDSFSVCGEIFDVQSENHSIGALTSYLASVLYQRMYCRPESYRLRVGPDIRAMHVFVDKLSRANGGNGTWDPGWIVKAIEEDGTLVVHKERDDLTLWARPKQFRVTSGPTDLGSIGRLRVSKELRGMLPGYYVVLGDADQRGNDVGAPIGIVRFYWHLTAKASLLWIA